MKIFVAGEGPTDVGDLAKDPAFRERRPREGFVQPVIRNLRPNDTVRFDGRKVMVLSREGFTELKAGLAKQASGAYRLAKTLGCDAVVVIHDVDRTQGKPVSQLERERRTAEVRRTIQDGFASVEDGSLATGIGTPCRCIEAWALGDKEAVVSLGALGDENAVPDRPEELWGQPKDPASNHPKCVLKRLLGGTISTDVYRALGEVSDPNKIQQSCPLSFSPFAEDVVSL